MLLSALKRNVAILLNASAWRGEDGWIAFTPFGFASVQHILLCAFAVHRHYDTVWENCGSTAAGAVFDENGSTKFGERAVWK